jgi:RNA polymerase sigma-70 factor (ECF subfamily)
MSISSIPVEARKDLITAAINGDRDSILTLLEATQPDIQRLARRQCRSSMDADDVSQETLLLLYQRLGMLRMPLALTGWLYTIIRRACLRLARANNFLELDDHTVELQLISRPTAELRIDLAHAINALPQHYREIVLLRDVEDFTIDEIGAALNLTRETVKGRLHRARLLIREYILD